MIDDEEEDEPSIPPPKTTYSTITPFPLIRYIVLMSQQSRQENYHRPAST